MKPDSADAPDRFTTSGTAPVAGTASPDSDEVCARRAQQGDAAALEALVQRHHAAVARLLWRFVRTQSDLDDLVQDTFLRMVRGLPDWEPKQPFGHWLLRIATNTGRDYFRRQTVRRRWMADPSPAADGDPRPEAIDPGADPAARAAASEAKAILEHLAPDDRALLTLHYLEGWGLPQIAAQFGWTHTATKLRAWRARRQLRALFQTSDLL